MIDSHDLFNVYALDEGRFCLIKTQSVDIAALHPSPPVKLTALLF